MKTGGVTRPETFTTTQQIVDLATFVSTKNGLPTVDAGQIIVHTDRWVFDVVLGSAIDEIHHLTVRP